MEISKILQLNSKYSIKRLDYTRYRVYLTEDPDQDFIVIMRNGKEWTLEMVVYNNIEYNLNKSGMLDCILKELDCNFIPEILKIVNVV